MPLPSLTTPPPRPLLLYDADCPFCRWSVMRARRITGPAIDYLPLQTEAPRFPQIPYARLIHAVHLIEPDGRVTRAGEAVLRTLALTPHPANAPARTAPFPARLARGLLRLYRFFPPFKWITEAAYRLVARHRAAAIGLVRRLAPAEARSIELDCDRENSAGCGRGAQ